MAGKQEFAELIVDSSLRVYGGKMPPPRRPHTELGLAAEFFFPLGFQLFAQAVVEFLRHGIGFAVTVERDGLLNIIDDDLAGITLLQMLLEIPADCGIDVAVDILIQCFQQFVAIHWIALKYTLLDPRAL